MSGGIHVRVAGEGDLAWLVEHDGHLGEADLRPKVAASEVFLAEVGGRPAGLVRIDLLWSRIPFVAQVRVLEGDRRRGVGRAMMEFVRARARAQGVGFVLSSSAADKAEPQACHRAFGFEECGFVARLNHDAVGEVFFRQDT
jgi:GNAT superfamily N-acetyltransferase